jgi:predicted ATPase
MRLLEYEYRDQEEEKEGGWIFTKVEFKKVNLMVGDTGTGKTRFLNSIFNLGRQVVHKELDQNGFWKIKFGIGQKIFSFELNIIINDKSEFVIKEEILKELKESVEIILVSRDQASFIFNDKELPKLSSNSSCISLLKEEESILEIYEAFSTILRRTFSLEGNNSYLSYQVLPIHVLKRIEAEPNLKRLFHSQLSLNVKLYVVKKMFPTLFNKIEEQYKSIFPFINEMKVVDSIVSEFDVPGLMPAFLIKEKNVSKWISLPELSSGMKKVLMILSDLILFPQNGIYLIDEYENSLGISAINFFPDLINSLEQSIQFILTSHHPYIINKISYENWFIFNRVGSKVSIFFGEEVKQRFSKSKQEAFIQLLNDDYYIRGKE